MKRRVYSIVRHPLYASLLFLGLAWTLDNLSPSQLIALAGCLWFFNYKADKEGETRLTERYRLALDAFGRARSRAFGPDANAGRPLLPVALFVEVGHDSSKLFACTPDPIGWEPRQIPAG